MRRRGYGDDEIPPELLAYAAEFGTPAEWHAARRNWLRAHPPRTLAELNALYEGVTWPPDEDPRRSRRLDAALTGLQDVEQS